MSNTYVPLWVKTNHSFLEGASFPEELIEQAHKLALPAIAITDRDGVYGLARAHIRAKELGVRIIAGAQLTVYHGSSPHTVFDDDRDVSRLVVLAKSRDGYASMCRVISKSHARCEKGKARTLLLDLLEMRDVFFLCADPSLLRTLHGLLGSSILFALCARHLNAAESENEKILRTIAKHLSVKTLAANEVLYHQRSRRSLQDVLSCIREGRLLMDAGHVIKPNAEHDLKPCDAFSKLFADDPQSVRRTLELSEQCQFTLDDIRYRYPGENLPENQTEQSWLRELTYRGAHKRYGAVIAEDVTTQLERELQIIEQLQYGGYFLTMYEIVDFCRENKILCQGRGSAANSAVCFCLGITAIDPVRMDLLFERFLSVERAEPPDIDLDIEHERREEVIQHVYAKYGRRHAAMVANVIRYRIRSAVRDVGKVLGISRTDLDTATKLLRHRDDTFNTQLLHDAGLAKDTPTTHLLWQMSSELLDFPRHLSIHPGGFLLGDRSVDELVPIEPATMEGRTVIQWDKYDVDNLALFKVDLLGLGALTCIHNAFDLLWQHKSIELDMATVPSEDPDTYSMISDGDTCGVFQIESRAQMAMLPRLQPKTFYDLVIEVAIVRPGPIQGDMVHPYLRRRQGVEQVEYPHPKLERILKKTLGVPIFQEQVMKLAVAAAGYTPGEADQLRRDMAAWRRSGRIEKHKDRMIPRMIEEGIPSDFAERVFSQIRGFGEYGFPESHAASFALLAYVTAWLRRHHHEVFTCAILNAQPMGFYSPATLVEDAKRHGVRVMPIHINKSRWNCSLESAQHTTAGTGSSTFENGTNEHAIRMGFRYVKGLGTVEREYLENQTQQYPNLATFVRNSKLSLKSLHALAEAGAFECFDLTRRDAIWKVRSLARFAHDSLPLEPSQSQISFASLSEDDSVLWDYRASQHSTRGHPMKRFRTQLKTKGVPTASEIARTTHGRHLEYVGMVICRQRPGTASGVTFFTLEDESGFVNVVVWRQVFERHATLAKTASLLGVRGEIQRADGVVHLIAKSLWAPEFATTQHRHQSRDFH